MISFRKTSSNFLLLLYSTSSLHRNMQSGLRSTIHSHAATLLQCGRAVTTATASTAYQNEDSNKQQQQATINDQRWWAQTRSYRRRSESHERWGRWGRSWVVSGTIIVSLWHKIEERSRDEKRGIFGVTNFIDLEEIVLFISFIFESTTVALEYGGALIKAPHWSATKP